MIEEDVRVAVDTFNRFRRPDIEARVVNIHENNAAIEFSGKMDKIEKNTSCIVVFSIQAAHESEDDPLQKALKILDKYNEGVPAAGFGYED